MNSVVTGIGWFGSGGLGRGGSGIGMPSGFERHGGRLPEIRRRDVFSSPYRDFGRMDAYSRLGLAALALALEDAGLSEWTEKRPFGLIAGTVYGCLQTDIDYFHAVMAASGNQASPSLFTYTLPNCFLGDAAIRFGLSGPAFVVNEPNPTGLAPMIMAVDSIAFGEADRVLCGVCELGRPPALERLGATVAGALFFMLEANPPAQRPDYGSVRVDRRADVFFSGQRMGTILDLAAACLGSGRRQNRLGEGR